MVRLQLIFLFYLTLAQFTQQPHALLSRRCCITDCTAGKTQEQTDGLNKKCLLDLGCLMLGLARNFGGAYPSVSVLHSSFGADLHYSAVQTHPFGGVAIRDREWETLNYWVTSDDCTVQLLYKLISEFYGGQKQEKKRNNSNCNSPLWPNNQHCISLVLSWQPNLPLKVFSFSFTQWFGSLNISDPLTVCTPQSWDCRCSQLCSGSHSCKDSPRTALDLDSTTPERLYMADWGINADTTFIIQGEHHDNEHNF